MAHSGLWASPDAAPGAAPVRAPQDRAPVSHGHAGAGARAGHAIQVVGHAAGLAAPGAVPVGAPQDRAPTPPAQEVLGRGEATAYKGVGVAVGWRWEVPPAAVLRRP